MNGVMQDNRFGLVVQATSAQAAGVPAASAWPDAEELRRLGVGCLRATVSDFDRFEAAVQGVPADVRVIALLGAEHLWRGDGPAGLPRWESAVRAFVARFGGRVWALECLSRWNERGLSPATAVACARSAGRIVREAGANVVCLLGAPTGLTWMASLQDATRLLTTADRELVRGAALHPYGRNARGFPGFNHTRYEHGEIDIAIQNAHDIVQLPIWATELGVPLQQAGGESGQARFVRDAFELLGALPASVLAAATYSCWQDTTAPSGWYGGERFGLRRAPAEGSVQPGEPRLAWHAFAAAAGRPMLCAGGAGGQR
jgi:hypothetical protein